MRFASLRETGSPRETRTTPRTARAPAARRPPAPDGARRGGPTAPAIPLALTPRPILASSFLLLVGFSLVAEGFHQEIPKGYLYFAMAFSVFVELINQRIRHATPVRLKKPITS